MTLTAETPQERIVNAFRATMPIVAASSPAPEDRNFVLDLFAQLEKVLGHKKTIRLFWFDLASEIKLVTRPVPNVVKLEDFQPYQQFEGGGDPITKALNFIQYTGELVKQKQQDNQEDPANFYNVFVVFDMHKYIGTDPNAVQKILIRRIQNLRDTLKQSYTRMVLVGQNLTLEPDLKGIVYQVENELPSLEQIKTYLDGLIPYLANTYVVQDPQFTVDLDAEERKRLDKAAQGLTLCEIGDMVRLSAIRNGRIDGDTHEIVSEAKIRKLRELNVEFLGTPQTEVGGLDNLKQWLRLRRKQFDIYSNNTQHLNIPSPKGVMLVGVSGAGKSLVGKAIGYEWGIPVLNFAMSDMLGSLVGQSESNLRQLLQTVEAIAPVVLYADEIEKAMGVTEGDGGTSKHLLGKFLTWMAEKTAPVFVVATANDISTLPPEFSRKGRFDEIFFLDVPNQSDRETILKIHLTRHNATLSPDDLKMLAGAANGFTGAEIQAAVDESALIALDRDEYPNISTAVLLQSIRETTPVSERDKEVVEAMRKWAARAAKPASSPQLAAMPAYESTETMI